MKERVNTKLALSQFLFRSLALLKIEFFLAVLALVSPLSLAAAEQPVQDSTAKSSMLRIAFLPFQNATGDPSWGNWQEALPGLVQTLLAKAEDVSAVRRKRLRPILEHAGWSPGRTVSEKLALQVARDSDAGAAVWGSFRRQTNQWAVEAVVLECGSNSAPTQLRVASPDWAGLARLLALRLSEHFQRPIREDELKNWNAYMTSSEPALQHLARAISIGAQDAPTIDKEKALRNALEADPSFGMAYSFLLDFLGEENRTEELKVIVQKYVSHCPELCGAHLALAWRLESERDAKGAERESREALRVHPGCPGACRELFMLLGGVEQRWEDLQKVLEQAYAGRADDHLNILLACARAQCGDLEGSRKLLEAVQELPEEDEPTDFALVTAAFLTGEFELAGRELTRLGPKAIEDEVIRDNLGSVRLLVRQGGGSSSNSPIARPRAFTAAELNTELERRLSPEERKLVVNPLEITPDIVAEARRLTIGLSNDVLRAVALYAEVAQRGRGGGQSGSRTAGQALEVSKNPRTRFSCQEYAKLFVALTRALGLEAWLVHVDRAADGNPCYHDCAALFLEGRGLLVDPTWRLFGVEHQAFIVLDDLQAISHQAMQGAGGPDPEPRRLRLGLKLNPDDRWTRLQFVRGMTTIGDSEAADAELRKAQAQGVATWDVYEATAGLEHSRGHSTAALAALEQALALAPSNALVQYKLASVYSELNQPARAAEHLKSAQLLDSGRMPEEMRQHVSLEVAMSQALAQAQAGDRLSREALERQAKSGAVAAQMALAKAYLDERPPRQEEGMRWLLKAAQQDVDQAQVNYAMNLLILRGEEAGPEAAQWLKKAADQGNVQAQYRLGLLLYEGKLIPKDNVAAARWVFLAADQGDRDAKTLLAEMRLFLSREELAEARKRADAFVPVKKRSYR